MRLQLGLAEARYVQHHVLSTTSLVYTFHSFPYLLDTPQRLLYPYSRVLGKLR
jgi:hypothetical protein